MARVFLEPSPQAARVRKQGLVTQRRRTIDQLVGRIRNPVEAVEGIVRGVGVEFDLQPGVVNCFMSSRMLPG